MIKGGYPLVGTSYELEGDPTGGFLADGFVWWVLLGGSVGNSSRMGAYLIVRMEVHREISYDG